MALPHYFHPNKGLLFTVLPGFLSVITLSKPTVLFKVSAVSNKLTLSIFCIPLRFPHEIPLKGIWLVYTSPAPKIRSEDTELKNAHLNIFEYRFIYFHCRLFLDYNLHQCTRHWKGKSFLALDYRIGFRYYLPSVE